MQSANVSTWKIGDVLFVERSDTQDRQCTFEGCKMKFKCSISFVGFVAAVSIVLVTLATGTSGVCFGQTSATDSLTIEQAIAQAIRNSPTLAQAEQEVAAADARIGASGSPRYPDVSFTGEYGRLDPVPEFEIPGGPTEKLAPEDNYDFHLGLRQILYDFGRTRTSIELASSGRQNAVDFKEQVKSNIAYRTISIFNSILILKRGVAVLDEQIEALNKHLEVSQKKVRAGTATDFDVLTTQVRIASVKNERIDTANSVETQEILFRQLTGLPSDQPVRLKGDFDGTSLSLAPDSLLDAAMRQRPEMKTSLNAEESATIRLHLASLADKPSLGLNLTSGFKNGYFPNLKTLKANLFAGVQLQLPIFDGNRRRHQEDEAEANRRSARIRTEDLARQIKTEVLQAASGARASLEKIENAKVQVRQAEEAVSIAKVKYEAGVVTNLDLLDTETTLTQAKLNYLRALYTYTVSLDSVDRATGKKTW